MREDEAGWREWREENKEDDQEENLIGGRFPVLIQSESEALASAVLLMKYRHINNPCGCSLARGALCPLSQLNSSLFSSVSDSALFLSSPIEAPG